MLTLKTSSPEKEQKSVMDRGLPLPLKPRREIWMLVTIWIISTLLLFALRPGYTFPPLDVIDSWVYTGYQWNIRAQIQEFGPTYYGSRLSFILPGALLHSFLPPLAANVCLKLAWSALLALGVAAIVLRAVGFRAALLAVALSVWSPQVIYAWHTDYMDGPVLTFAVLALACITLARDSKRWAGWIAAAGCFFTGMGVANLSALATVGFGVAIYHLIWLRWGFVRHLICIGLYLAAAAAVLSVLGFVHQRLGGQFLFMQPQVDMLLHLNQLDRNPWAQTGWSWLTRATWLVVPASALVWGALKSLGPVPPALRTAQLTRALTAALAVSVGSSLAVAISGQGVLAHDFYASFHLCLAIPLLAVCCTSSIRSAHAAFGWVAATLGLLAAHALWGETDSTAGLVHRWTPWIDLKHTIILAALGMVLVLAAAWIFGGVVRRGWRAGLPRPELLLLAIYACSTPTSFHDAAISDRLPQRYLAVREGFDRITQEFPPNSYRFWSHPQQMASMALSATKLWGYRLFTFKPFPSFEATDRTDHTIIVTGKAGTGETVLGEAERAFANARLQVADGRVLHVAPDSDVGIDLVAFRMRESAVDPEQFFAELARRPRAVLDLRYAGDEPFTRALERNIYGGNPQKVIDESAGYPIFRRTDPRDHLATPFLELPSAVTDGGRELSLVITMVAASSTVCVVQSDSFHDLRQISLGERGRTVHRVKLPANVGKVRLYFISTRDAPSALPTRVTLYQLPAELP